MLADTDRVVNKMAVQSEYQANKLHSCHFFIVCDFALHCNSTTSCMIQNTTEMYILNELIAKISSSTC